MNWNQNSARILLWFGSIGFLVLLLLVPQYFMDRNAYVSYLKLLGSFILAFGALVVIWYFTTFRPLLREGIFSPIVLQRLNNGDRIKLINILPSPEGLGWDKQTILRSEQSYQGYKDSLRYSLVMAEMNNAARPSVVAIELTQGIRGQFIITYDPTIGDGFARANKLESLQFNKMFQVYASEASLAPAVLPPNFMDWLMAKNHPEIISLKDSLLTVWFSGRGEAMTNDQAVTQAFEVVHFLERSGALEQTLKGE